MKKLICLVLILALLAGNLMSAAAAENTETEGSDPATEVASGTCGENLTWTLKDGVLTISGTGDMDSWFPYELLDEAATFAPWYDLAEEILSVKVEEGVTGIGHFAFFGCVNLTDVSIAESVTNVGGAFVGCDSLTELYIPASVAKFTYPTNEGVCRGLKKITVAEENTVYSTDAAGMLYNKDKTVFIGCPTAYEGVCDMADTVTAIGAFAFNECSKVTGILIPEGVTAIEYYTFLGCEQLGGLTLPDSVESIGECAFYNCSSLTHITFPAGLKKMYNYLFDGCTSLNSLTFTGDAPEIGYAAFYGITAKAYYPAGNDTWTETVMEDYTGTITWVPGSGAAAVTGDFTGDEVVDDEDVAYLLWYTMFPEMSPVNAGADFTGDGVADDEDVAYLLWHTMFPEKYPLDGND